MKCILRGVLFETLFWDSTKEALTALLQKSMNTFYWIRNGENTYFAGRKMGDILVYFLHSIKLKII